MLKPDPFKDAEVNPEPPSRDWRDYAELTLSFLWFYHKTIIAIFLLAGLGILSYRLTTEPKPVAESDGKPMVTKSIEDIRPKANIDFVLSSQLELTEARDLSPAEADDNPSAEIDANPSADTGFDLSTEAVPETRPVSKNPRVMPNRLLETGTVDELIEASLKINEAWGSAKPSAGLRMCSQRAKISQRLLEMELTDSQRTFAITSYIESISLVDSLNIASKMNLSGTGEALLEIDEKFSNHPDPTVYAKANLAMTLSPLYEFIANRDLDQLQEFQNRFRQRLDRIAPDPASLGRLAEVAIAMYNKPGLPEDRRPVIVDLMERLFELKSPASRQIAVKFRERYLFDEFDLNSLPELTYDNSLETRKKIMSFFQTLAENPDTGSRVYQTAFSIIRAYQRAGRVSDVEALTNWLNKISDGIPLESNRQSVKKAIQGINPE